VAAAVAISLSDGAGVVTGTQNTVIEMDLEPTFRAHPRHTFRILANAIYHGQE